MSLTILSSDGSAIREGAECEFEATIVGRSRWRSKITHMKPYEYIDEMTGGIFKSWKHLHRFVRLGNQVTEVEDQIDFELPFGPLGRAFEPLASRRLTQVFEYRKTATISELGSKV